eukprot:852763-Prorocentrum_minimum.AAC.1
MITPPGPCLALSWGVQTFVDRACMCGAGRGVWGIRQVPRSVPNPQLMEMRGSVEDVKVPPS